MMLKNTLSTLILGLLVSVGANAASVTCNMIVGKDAKGSGDIVMNPGDKEETYEFKGYTATVKLTDMDKEDTSLFPRAPVFVLISKIDKDKDGNPVTIPLASTTMVHNVNKYIPLVIKNGYSNPEATESERNNDAVTFTCSGGPYLP